MNKLSIVVVALLLLGFHADGHADQKPQRFNISASDAHNFVWFRVAKVGTRTISKILRDNSVPYSAKGMRLPFKPKKYQQHFKFAFVRNPWARVVSCYFNKVVTQVHRPFSECFDKDFDFFVDFIAKKDLKKADIHIRLQTRLFPADEVNFIGRLENFSEDLQKVFHIIGVPCPETIPHKNRSRHKHYSSYYNERTKQIIADKYKADIDAFGYEFETK